MVKNHSASARRCVGLRLFSECLGQHVLVEGEIGDPLFQPAILILHLPQPAELTDTQVGVFLFPEVERRLADAELARDVTSGRAALGLPDGVGDLLLGEFRALHGPLLF